MTQYFFMVGTESLNIDNITLVHNSIGSGIVPNYTSVKEAINALITKTNEFIELDNELLKEA